MTWLPHRFGCTTGRYPPSDPVGDTGHFMSLVVTILLLGLLAGLSPATIIVFILVLATTRAKVNAAAFLIGWSVSLVVVFGVSYTVGGTHTLQQGGGRPALEIIEILLGIALIFAASRQWQHRNRPEPIGGNPQSHCPPAKAQPVQAAIVGILKQPWALTAAAAVVVIRDHAAWEVALIAFIVFTVVSTATVGLTFLYFARRPGEAARSPRRAQGSGGACRSDHRGRRVPAGGSVPHRRRSQGHREFVTRCEWSWRRNSAWDLLGLRGGHRFKRSQSPGA